MLAPTLPPILADGFVTRSPFEVRRILGLRTLTSFRPRFAILVIFLPVKVLSEDNIMLLQIYVKRQNILTFPLNIPEIGSASSLFGEGGPAG
jgi:hypothetical protein